MQKKKVIRIDPGLFESVADFVINMRLAPAGAGPAVIIENALSYLLTRRVTYDKLQGNVDAWLADGGQELINSDKSKADVTTPVPLSVLCNIEERRQATTDLQDFVPDNITMRERTLPEKDPKPWDNLPKVNLNKANLLAPSCALMTWAKKEPENKLRILAAECTFGVVSQFLWNEEKSVKTAKVLYTQFKDYESSHKGGDA